jgi:lambda family phage portal protein
MSADAEIYSALSILRARSRDLAMNHVYGKRFLNLLKQNVIGPNGIQVESIVTKPRGQRDEVVNTMIDSAYDEWCQRGICTVDGKLSMVGVDQLIMTTVASDGELLIRKMRGWPGNRFGFAIQLIEADQLDIELNRKLQNGHEIRMGVEFDAYRRPVAYWVLKDHPNDFFYGVGYSRSKYTRIPAEDIIHPFIFERIGQSRGVPWMAAAADRAKMLDGYEEAELVAARTAAAKMGFFKEPDNEDWEGDDPDSADDVSQPPVMDAEAGSFANIGRMDFKAWTPEHPVAAFEMFVQSILRDISSGWNVSYVSLGNDLRGVSYSSIRQGALDERDYWRLLQKWAIENFKAEIRSEWLRSSITFGAINLPIVDRGFSFYDKPMWKPRGWEWVDPLKEVMANERAAKNFFKPVQEIVSSSGGDIYDNIDAAVEVRKAFDKVGLMIPALYEFENTIKPKEQKNGNTEPDSQG